MQFEDPPPIENKPDRAYWVSVVQALKENPGKAGKTGPYSVGVANNIRHGRYVAFLPKPLVDQCDWDARREYMDRHWHITTRQAGSRERQHVYVTWEADGCGCKWCQQ